MRTLKHALGLLLALLCAQAAADVEIIPLRYRTVEQVIPILQPLVEPGGALSGSQGQLILRSSAANIADLKRVLATIDAPQRRLLISVRQDLDGADSGRGANVTGTIGTGRVVIGNVPGGTQGTLSGNSPGNVSSDRISVRIGETNTRRDERIDQQVQALEGSPAYISVGTSRPLPTRNVVRTPQGVVVTDSVTYQDISTGFEVVPRVAGDRVFLDINPRRETPGPNGTVNVQRVSTSASGRLGEWFEIGAMAQSSNSTSSGILSSNAAERQENRRVWVKVEQLR
jgi:type II secretory pathway component GspD/PulD (secretin)